MQDKKYLNSSETAQYLNVSRSYLYAMTRRGMIPCVRPFGRKILYLKSELDKLMTNKI